MPMSVVKFISSVRSRLWAYECRRYSGEMMELLSTSATMPICVPMARSRTRLFARKTKN